MEDVSLVVSKAEKILKNRGYKIIYGNLPKEFNWKPDIFARKRKKAIALLIRQSDSVPEVLVQRIASMKRFMERLYPSIVFCKKPNSATINLIKLYGVGIKYLRGNALSVISKPKDFSKAGRKEIKKDVKRKRKLPRTDIFVSSHQNIDERKSADRLIEELRNVHFFPVYTILVEDDPRHSIRQKKEGMNKNMEDSDLFLGILAEEFRPDVDYEVRMTIKKYFLERDILIFIKSSKKTKSSWKKLIKWIKDQNTVKYHEYSDIKNFERKCMRVLMLKIKDLHKKFRIEFYQ